MAERLCQEVAQFLADHDDRTDDQPGAGFARARVAVSLAEGLDAEVGGGPRDRATAADDPGRLAAFLDLGLPQSERNAVVAALADDATRRAEASSAAAFLDGIDRACPPLPAGLVERAVEAFGATLQQGRPVGRGEWSRSWLPPRVLLPSFVALVLVAVLTPVVLSLIWDGRDASVGDTRSGPIERSLFPPPDTGKRTPADRSTADPAARSCEPAANAAQSDRPAGNTHKAGTEATEPAGGEMKKPEERGAAQSAGTSAEDPCRPGLSVEGGRASTRPPAPAPARN
jgi:hypothetical protein